MSVRWRPIAGYEGIYEVSSQGNVRSLDRVVSSGHRRRGRVLQFTNGDNAPYSQVGLSKANKVKVCDVHRLVAAAFIGPCPPGMQVRHKNGSARDNRAVNLGYATPKQNTRDKLKHGTMLRGSRHPSAKMHEGDVERIRDITCVGGLTQNKIAEHLGLSWSQVNKVIGGTRWNN